MATPTADKLRIHFPSRNLAAHGDALPAFPISGGDRRTIESGSITQASGYWDGALGWFDAGTDDPDLAGAFFHVREQTGNALLLSRDLPGTPAPGDTFRLVVGGNYRSAQETFGLTVGGYLPEIHPVAGVQVTGVTIKKASAYLGTGELSVVYTHASKLLRIKMNGQELGVGIDVTSNVTDGIVFAEDGHGYIRVDVVAASLPTANRTDLWTLQSPTGTFTPDFEGYETANGEGGKTRYRLETIQNTDSGEGMVDILVYTGKPSGTSTTVATGQSLGLARGSFDVVNASDWPTRGFWIRNTSANSGAGDCRYVNYRSGNTLYCLAVDWARLGFKDGTSEIQPGDAINDASTGATAIVDQVAVASGDWGSGDATGSLLLRKVTGQFGNNNNIRIGTTVHAKADGSSILGLRGLTGVSWSAGQTIVPMADIDIGGDAPGAGSYRNPDAVSVAPESVNFAEYSSPAKTLPLGELPPNGLHGVWRREWIMDGHQSRAGINADTFYMWT